MIELIVKDILENALDGADVYMELPDLSTLPRTEFVLVEKTGSSMKDHIYHATVAVQSYGATLYKAAELNETVRTAMLTAGETDRRLSAVKLNSDYPFNDIENRRYRYQAVFDIYY